MSDSQWVVTERSRFGVCGAWGPECSPGRSGRQAAGRPNAACPGHNVLARENPVLAPNEIMTESSWVFPSPSVVRNRGGRREPLGAHPPGLIGLGGAMGPPPRPPPPPDTIIIMARRGEAVFWTSLDGLDNALDRGG
jgi:hypothetical protein